MLRETEPNTDIETPTSTMDIKYPNVVTDVITKLPGSLPELQLPTGIDAPAVIQRCLQYLSAPEEEHFTKGALWRDTFALTGTLRTIYSGSAICNIWKCTSANQRPTNFQLVAESCHVVSPSDKSSWLEARFTFKTHGDPSTTCSGFLSIVFEPRLGWQIWMLRTVLEQLSGEADVDKGLYRSQSQLINGRPDNETDQPHKEQPHFDCVIVGGGQSGLSTAGRLQSLGVSYVVLEKYNNIGDNWKMRYDAVKRTL